MSPTYDRGRPGGSDLCVEKRQQLDGGSLSRGPRWVVPDAAANGHALVVEDVVRRRWLAVVDRTPSYVVPAEYRLVLIAYGRHMRSDGFVSCSREKLATSLGAPERKVQRALQRARRAGLLRYLAGGHQGVTTEYQACLRLHDVSPDGLPVSPPMPRTTQAKGDSRETREDPERETRPTSLGRETPAVSPREELQREPRELVAVDHSATDEPTTTVLAPAVTSWPANSGNERGSGSPLPLAAPVITRSTHVCRPGCHGFDLLLAMYAREAA